MYQRNNFFLYFSSCLFGWIFFFSYWAVHRTGFEFDIAKLHNKKKKFFTLLWMQISITKKNWCWQCRYALPNGSSQCGTCILLIYLFIIIIIFFALFRFVSIVAWRTWVSIKIIFKKKNLVCFFSFYFVWFWKMQIDTRYIWFNFMKILLKSFYSTWQSMLSTSK